jgi:iron complex transport system substrate-binding protein
VPDGRFPPTTDPEGNTITTPRRIRTALAAASLALAAGACGTATHQTAPPAATTTPPPAPTTTTPAGYPVTVRTPSGSTVIRARPTRIVSLSPTATEDLFAIGAGSLVVAADKYSDYPAAAPTTKLDPLNPNLEAIATYRPDLVVGSDEPANFAPQMAKLGITTLNEPAATNLDQAYEEIQSLGAATGRAAGADALVAGMKARIAALVAEVHPSSPATTYYYELSPDYYSLTSDTFVGQLLSLLGLKDIADARGVNAAGGYPQLSSESIIAARPDLIFLADTICCGQSAKTVKGRPGWSTIPAVAAGDVVALNDDIASRWGPRLVTLLSDVVTAVHKVQARP